jgi:hypothetical protein
MRMGSTYGTLSAWQWAGSFCAGAGLDNVIANPQSCRDEMRMGHGQERRGGKRRSLVKTFYCSSSASSIVIVCAWLAWQYSASTENEARSYAAHTLDRLSFAHDAKYLAINLSSVARPGYPASQQKYAITSLTKLGSPVAPIIPHAGCQS